MTDSSPGEGMSTSFHTGQRHALFPDLAIISFHPHLGRFSTKKYVRPSLAVISPCPGSCYFKVPPKVNQWPDYEHSSIYIFSKKVSSQIIFWPFQVHHPLTRIECDGVPGVRSALCLFHQKPVGLYGYMASTD